jgi:iron complex outermembrane recepter protein
MRSHLASFFALKCRIGKALFFLGLSFVLGPNSPDICRGAVRAPAAIRIITDADGRADSEVAPRMPIGDDAVLPATNLEQQDPLRRRPEVQPETRLPQTAETIAPRYFGDVASGLPNLERRIKESLASNDRVYGGESKIRPATDAGNLLGQSPLAIGVGAQRRTPVVNEPRVRASRIGQLAASGSYWIPARIDLDTALSKLDSNLIGDITVVKGPYSVRNGPGLEFIDVNLINTPRFENGFEAHGSTIGDFHTNGQQWHARQDVWGGNAGWGFRAGYGHRGGNDYLSGNGEPMAAGYDSGDAFFAFGYDPSPDSSTEFNYLRVDQNDVLYPGMAFDIDWLGTNAYDYRLVWQNQAYFDRFELDVWHNRTKFTGDAQRPSKRVEFPYLDFIDYVGFTDVEASSTGFRAIASWGDEDGPLFSLGADLRYIMQQLDEIGSGGVGFLQFTDANSPIPRSQSMNPGIFAEQRLPCTEKLTLTLGARADLLDAEVTANPASLQRLGNMPAFLQPSFYDIVGTNDVDRQFGTWAAYLRGEYDLDDQLTLVGGYGYGQRPPSLTEMYVCQSFMFVLQNGLNTLTGDPRLNPEQMHQIDWGLQWNYPRFRGGAYGFYALAHDYLTFENMNVVYGPPSGNVVQENLKYVNTDLASFIGAELYSEFDWTDWLTPYAALSYVQGEDLTRNGDFATRQAGPFVPSVRVDGLPRGFFSGIAGGASEPLPQIVPLESRLGFRFHERGKRPRWGVDIGPRLVAAQTRVAASLLESPTPGFTTWNLQAFWRPSERWLFITGVENFTNRNYQEHLDFRSADGYKMLQPGISYYFGTQLVY